MFDALLTKSQSVWTAIGNSLKTALLTAIKDVVTSRVAATLMQMFTGQKVTFAGGGAGPGGSGGMLGGLGGLLGIGAVPVFGGTGGGCGPCWRRGGRLGHASILYRRAGAAAVSRWAAAVLLRGCCWRRRSRRRLAASSNLKQSISGWKDMLTNLGNIGYKPERWRIDEIGGDPYKVADAKGIGGMKGGAMLAAGAMLAMDGLRRGGKIGRRGDDGGRRADRREVRRSAGRGDRRGSRASLAGMVRLFIKGAAEKAREKIKALYGVDIPDKGVLQQIVDTAKQSYRRQPRHGDPVAADPRPDPVVRHEHRAKPTGMPATVTPLSTGPDGRVAVPVQRSISNGQPLPGAGGLPSLDQVGGGVAIQRGRDRCHPAPDRLAGGRQCGHPEPARRDRRARSSARRATLAGAS